MRYRHIDHHGTQRRVTGSCRLLHMAAGDSLLRDYGLFQGHEPSADGRRGAAQHNVEFSLPTIKALIVTHVHIDHVGRIPHLLAAGYNGPICSAPSAKLLPIVLEDAFKLGFSRDSKEIARYHKLAEQRLYPLPYNQWFVLLKTSQLCPRIRSASDLVGSAYAKIDLTSSRHWRAQTRRAFRLPRLRRMLHYSCRLLELVMDVTVGDTNGAWRRHNPSRY